jgi:hypothetical protein
VVSVPAKWSEESAAGGNGQTRDFKFSDGGTERRSPDEQWMNSGNTVNGVDSPARVTRRRFRHKLSDLPALRSPFVGAHPLCINVQRNSRRGMS